MTINNQDSSNTQTPIKRRRSSILNIIPSMLLGSSSSDLLSNTGQPTTSNTTSLALPQSYNICVLGTKGVGKKSLVSYMINGYYNPSTFMNHSIRLVGEEEEIEDEVSTWTNDDQSTLSERSSSYSSLHSFRKDDDSSKRPDFVKIVEVEQGEKNIKLNFFLLTHSFSDVRNRNLMDSDLEFVKTVAKAHLVIMVYDVTEQSSFESLILYYEQLSKIASNVPSDDVGMDSFANFKFGSPQSPALLVTSPRTPRGSQRKIMAVGVKTDLEEDRTVSESHILSHRNVIGSDIKFYECSSVTGENVLTIFEDVKEVAKSMLFRPKAIPIIETKQRRSSLVISSSRNNNNSAASSTPNLDNRRSSLRLVDSFKNIGNKIRNRSSISTSSPVINDKRRSQSIGLIISQHEQNTGFKITTLDSVAPQTPQNISKSYPPTDPPPSKEIRKRPNTLFNIFKRK